MLVYGEILLIARFLPVVVGERWWFLYSSAFSMWFYLYYFGLIARCVLETGISFGGSVWFLLQTALLGYLIRASVLAGICNVSAAYWNSTAFVQKQRRLFSQSFSFGLGTPVLGLRPFSLSVLTLSRNLSLYPSCHSMEPFYRRVWVDIKNTSM